MDSATHSVCFGCWDAVTPETTVCPRCELTRPPEGWSSEPLAGRVLAGGKYKLLEPLGVGGFGMTAKAVQFAHGRALGAVVVKLPLLSYPPEELARFLDEAVAIRRVQHPNVVALHDAFIERDVPYLVLELVSGHTLLDELGMRGPLHVVDALDITLQLADALSELHTKGVVHCDLNPRNVLLVRWGHASPFAKLVDFGVAALWTRGPGWRQSVVACAPGFAAPEQFAGRVEPASDVFGLGVLFHLMVTGKLPYPPELFLGGEVLTVPRPQLPDTVPAEARSVLEKLLEPDVSKRYRGLPGLVELLRATREAAAMGPAPSSSPLPSATPPAPAVPSEEGAHGRRGQALLRLAEEAYREAVMRGGVMSTDGQRHYARAAKLFATAAQHGPLPAHLATLAENAHSRAAGTRPRPRDEHERLVSEGRLRFEQGERERDAAARRQVFAEVVALFEQAAALQPLATAYGALLDKARKRAAGPPPPRPAAPAGASTALDEAPRQPSSLFTPLKKWFGAGS